MCSRTRSSDNPELLCPSAQPGLVGAVAFGLIDHHAEPPTTGFFEHTVPVTPELLEMAAPLLPTQVFRFSAPCQQQQCSHWQCECTLIDRIVKLVPVSSLTLPPCPIRAGCRWFAQQGRDACQRCPQVVTQDTRPTEAMAVAAQPPAAPRNDHR